MNHTVRKIRAGVIAGLLLACSGLAATAQTITDLQRGFEQPPNDARIMMRWWWFGPTVVKPELEREMRLMKEGGIGGFEVQPVYPLQVENNQRYLSPEFLDALTFAAAKARELGLRMDITLGSGWPFGGPHVPITQAAGRLRCDRVAAPSGAVSMAMPNLSAGEKLMAVFLAEGDRRQFSAKNIRRIGDVERG